MLHECSHVGCWMMRLQPCTLIDGLGKGSSMRTTEAISHKVRYLLVDYLRSYRVHASCNSTVDERAAHMFHHFTIAILRHKRTKVICLIKGHSCKAMRDLQHLFLKEDDAEGILEYWLKIRMHVRDWLSTPTSSDIGVYHATL